MAGRIAAIHSLSFDVLTALFDQLPLGVVVLDREGKVVVYNQREQELARRRREDVLGRSFFAEVAPCLDVRELSGRFASGVGRDALDVNLEFSFAPGGGSDQRESSIASCPPSKNDFHVGSPFA